MTKEKNYKKTLIACYLGFVTQAISANFTPLLFLTFKSTYGITLDKIAMIPMVFYLTQLLVDFAATKFADKIGYRTCVVASQVVSAVGLVLMAILPDMLPVPFIGILISVVLYAIGSGLVEVLVSPIVEACPFENKDGVMSLLHSFYCWGAMGVILGSTLFFSVVGVEHWKILTFIWALVPLYNTFNFINCPIERLVEDGKSLGVCKLLKTPIFWLIIMLMVCSGASEATMAQWASAFTESAIGVSKTVGDLAGPCLFAMFMGIARMLYGKFSEKLDLTKVMLFLLNEMNDLLTERLFQSSAAGIIFVKAKRKALGPVTREAASLFLHIVSSLMYGLKNYYLSLIHSIAHKYGEVCRNR